MNRKIYFHLGKNIEISIAEILVVFKHQLKNLRLVKERNLLKGETNLDNLEIQIMIKNMGGVPKISEELTELPVSISLNGLIREISNEIYNINFQNSSKVSFSLNQENITLPVKKIGFGIKDELVEQGKKVRFVNTGSSNLNSVSILKNKLILKGLDLNLIQDGNLFLTKTIAVQDSISYSNRDYNRPCRNAKNGMLPPKLVQIMLNLSGVKKEQTILDPFCGSGTVGQEALLRDINFYLSDLNPEMIQDAKKNIDWALKKIKKDHTTSLDNKIKTLDALNISEEFKDIRFEAILTEGYLGPPQSHYPDDKKIYDIIKSLLSINIPFLTQARNILTRNGIIVMILPIFVNIKKKNFYFSDYLLPKISQDYHNAFLSDKNLIILNSLLKSNSLRLTYERPDQIVKREIVLLKPKTSN
jgi:tRNA G10  N-methylase Trm11